MKRHISPGGDIECPAACHACLSHPHLSVALPIANLSANISSHSGVFVITDELTLNPHLSSKSETYGKDILKVLFILWVSKWMITHIYYML